MDEGFSIVATMEGNSLQVRLVGNGHEIASFEGDQELIETPQSLFLNGASTKAVGEAVGRALLPKALSSALQVRASRTLARGGRLLLSFEPGGTPLEAIPWEAIHVSRDRPTDPLEGHLALHPRVRLTRGSIPSANATQDPTSSLRVLFVSADPGTADFPRLGWLESEHRAVAAAMHMARRPGVEFRTIFDAGPAPLARALTEFKPNIVHFAGHGVQRPSGGYIVLQGEGVGRPAFVGGRELSQWLNPEETRLVIMSACDTASLAAELARVGMPSVMGIREALRDACQPSFVRTLYGALVDGGTVSDAVAEARQALPAGAADWALPVLFCRKDHRFFFGGPRDRTRPDVPYADRLIVGRDSEVAKVCSIIKRPGAPAVVLTGLGGIGKTRLAAEIAVQVADAFPDGVCFVECDGVADPERFYSSILGSMKSTVSGGDLLGSLEKELRHCRRLLILDCCDEFIASEGSSCIAQLLEDGPSCAVLATSRIPLRCPGSVEVQVLPLSLTEDPMDTTASIELFLQTARLSEKSLSPEDRRACGDICTRLDGIPLAIVLCAARLNSASIQELRDLVARNPLRVSSNAWSDEPGCSVAAAIRRSLDLVPPYDRELLSRLCVFSGGFSWGDAVAVLSDNDPLDLFDGLKRLTDCALLRRDGPQGRQRFRLLDTVRECAVEPESYNPIFSKRHAAHFASLATQLISDETGGFSMFAPDLDNFRVAAAFADSADMSVEASKLADGLSRNLLEAGLTNDFLNFIAIGKRAAVALGDLGAEARLLGLEGAFAARVGDEDVCAIAWQRRAAICDETGDHLGAADALTDLAVQAHERGDAALCEQLLDEAEVRLGPSGNAEMRATVLVMRARLALDAGNQTLALSLAIEAEALAITARNRDPLLFVDLNIARVLACCGKRQESQVKLIKILRDSVNGNRRTHMATALIELSIIHEEAGLVELGLLEVTAAVRIWDAVRSRRASEMVRRLAAYRQRHFGHPAIHRDFNDSGMAIVHEVISRIELLV